MNKNSEPESALAAVPILAGLSKRQRSRLHERSRIVQHPAGKVVAAEGDGALALHVVLSGTATVTVGGQEKRTLSTGDHFGEISLIDGRPRSATVTATEPLTTLAVPHMVFQSVLDDDPTCARGLLTVLCARLREAETRAG
jgi:CRP/FNR family transcriptional regulator, cyclic AMP receptor protein